jgi:eyes absent family protein 4
VSQALYAETDAATGGWLSHAAALLHDCVSQLSAAAGCPVTPVAVTSGQLVPSLAKLLLFKLDSWIAAEHAWSSRHCGKAACFQSVLQRFGASCTYVAIGAGPGCHWQSCAAESKSPSLPNWRLPGA